MWRVMRPLGAVFAALAWLLSAPAGVGPAAAAEAVVTDFRVGYKDGTTRFVFDLSHRVGYHVFTLADPYRVVIDLPEVGWRLPARPLPSGKGLLERVRYGLFKPGTSRVVLDVNAPSAIDKVFLMAPGGSRGYRLVLDLVETSRQAFITQSTGPGLRVSASQPPPPPPPGASATAAAMRFLPPRKPTRAGITRLIVIDPGHGGVDPGTIGVSGIYEKHITLTMAREIKSRLERSGRYKVLLTRNRDIFIRLRDRIAFAREANAELFLSIHADAIRNRNIRGLSVYTLSERASDKEAAALAEKENKADLISGIAFEEYPADVNGILIDLTQRETMNQSVRFAARLVKELGRETKVLRNSHRFAGFAVLKSPDVPSVLLELGFLSNRKEEKALRTKTYRAKLAAATVRAIGGYFAGVEEAYRK